MSSSARLTIAHQIMFWFGSADLMANSRQVGVNITQDLLRHFGVDVPDGVLFDWQDQVLS